MIINKILPNSAFLVSSASHLDNKDPPQSAVTVQEVDAWISKAEDIVARLNTLETVSDFMSVQITKREMQKAAREYKTAREFIAVFDRHVNNAAINAERAASNIANIPEELRSFKKFVAARLNKEGYCNCGSYGFSALQKASDYMGQAISDLQRLKRRLKLHPFVKDKINHNIQQLKSIHLSIESLSKETSRIVV